MPKKKLTLNGCELIEAERRRQIAREGWTPDHDDLHDKNELLHAACCYIEVCVPGGPTFHAWPFEVFSWKPSTEIHNLVKAGALIAAEIDRLQRRVAPGEES